MSPVKLIPIALQIVREATALSAAVRSRHSVSQWGGNFTALFIASTIVAAITYFAPEFIGAPDAAVAMVLSIVVVISPVISRAIAVSTFVEKANDDTPLIKVRFPNSEIWSRTKVNIRQARSLGYGYGVTKEGKIVDLKTRLYVGEMRLGPSDRKEIDTDGNRESTAQD